MRFLSFLTFIRAFHTFTNTTRAVSRTSSIGRTLYTPPQRTGVYQTMVNIPFIGALFGSSMADDPSYPVTKPEGEWRATLTPQQFRVLREKGTETPGTGEFNKHFPNSGVYSCGACREPLYTANTKFDSGCGWPAFWDTIPGKVGQRPEPGLGIIRTEIVCNNCGGHLGHIFKGEKFGNPKDERHCVNSISLNFKATETN